MIIKYWHDVINRINYRIDIEFQVYNIDFPTL